MQNIMTEQLSYVLQFFVNSLVHHALEQEACKEENSRSTKLDIQRYEIAGDIFFIDVEIGH